jgi:hypothetical protein
MSRLDRGQALDTGGDVRTEDGYVSRQSAIPFNGSTNFADPGRAIGAAAFSTVWKAIADICEGQRPRPSLRCLAQDQDSRLQIPDSPVAH